MRFLIYPLLTLAGIACSQTLLALLLDQAGLVGPRFTVTDLVTGGAVLALAGGLASYAMARHLVEQSLKGDRAPNSVEESAVGRAIHGICAKLGLKTPPAIAVYQSLLPDAIGAGPLPSRSVLAVSSGLIERLGRPEAEAILAHALARVKAGDAALLPFIQGMIHVYTLFPARMMALLLGTTLRTAEEDTPSDPVENIMIVSLDALLTLGGSLVVRHYARHAERRADAAATVAVGKSALADGLRLYAASHEPHRDAFSAALRFGAHVRPAWRMFSHHVPLSGRLKSTT